jgi:hypothetical protein
MEPNTIWRVEEEGGDAILKRRQVAAIVSIALISFLIGTTVNLLTMAKDRGVNPFDRVWEAVFEIEDRLDSVECDNKTGFVNAPAYDSGWESTGVGEEIVFPHNLNTTEVFVHVIGKDIGETYKIHQFEYGATYWAYWHKLDLNNISVTADYPWDYVRVMIWIIQELPI